MLYIACWIALWTSIVQGCTFPSTPLRDDESHFVQCDFKTSQCPSGYSCKHLWLGVNLCCSDTKDETQPSMQPLLNLLESGNAEDGTLKRIAISNDSRLFRPSVKAIRPPGQRPQVDLSLSRTNGPNQQQSGYVGGQNSGAVVGGTQATILPGAVTNNPVGTFGQGGGYTIRPGITQPNEAVTNFPPQNGRTPSGQFPGVVYPLTPEFGPSGYGQTTQQLNFIQASTRINLPSNQQTGGLIQTTLAVGNFQTNQQPGGSIQNTQPPIYSTSYPIRPPSVLQTDNPAYQIAVDPSKPPTNFPIGTGSYIGSTNRPVEPNRITDRPLLGATTPQTQYVSQVPTNIGPQFVSTANPLGIITDIPNNLGELVSSGTISQTGGFVPNGYNQQSPAPPVNVAVESGTTGAQNGQPTAPTQFQNPTSNIATATSGSNVVTDIPNSLVEFVSGGVVGQTGGFIPNNGYNQPSQPPPINIGVESGTTGSQNLQQIGSTPSSQSSQPPNPTSNSGNVITDIPNNLVEFVSSGIGGQTGGFIPNGGYNQQSQPPPINVAVGGTTVAQNVQPTDSTSSAQSGQTPNPTSNNGVSSSNGNVVTDIPNSLVEFVSNSGTVGQTGGFIPNGYNQQSQPPPINVAVGGTTGSQNFQPTDSTPSVQSGQTPSPTSNNGVSTSNGNVVTDIPNSLVEFVSNGGTVGQTGGFIPNGYNQQSQPPPINVAVGGTTGSQNLQPTDSIPSVQSGQTPSPTSNNGVSSSNGNVVTDIPNSLVEFVSNGGTVGQTRGSVPNNGYNQRSQPPLINGAVSGTTGSQGGQPTPATTNIEITGTLGQQTGATGQGRPTDIVTNTPNRPVEFVSSGVIGQTGGFVPNGYNQPSQPPPINVAIDSGTTGSQSRQATVAGISESATVAQQTGQSRPAGVVTDIPSELTNSGAISFSSSPSGGQQTDGPNQGIPSNVVTDIPNENLNVVGSTVGAQNPNIATIQPNTYNNGIGGAENVGSGNTANPSQFLIGTTASQNIDPRNPYSSAPGAIAVTSNPGGYQPITTPNFVIGTTNIQNQPSGIVTDIPKELINAIFGAMVSQGGQPQPLDKQKLLNGGYENPQGNSNSGSGGSQTQTNGPSSQVSTLVPFQVGAGQTTVVQAGIGVVQQTGAQEIKSSTGFAGYGLTQQQQQQTTRNPSENTISSSNAGIGVIRSIGTQQPIGGYNPNANTGAGVQQPLTQGNQQQTNPQTTSQGSFTTPPVAFVSQGQQGTNNPLQGQSNAVVATTNAFNPNPIPYGREALAVQKQNIETDTFDLLQHAFKTLVPILPGTNESTLIIKPSPHQNRSLVENTSATIEPVNSGLVSTDPFSATGQEKSEKVNSDTRTSISSAANKSVEKSATISSRAAANQQPSKGIEIAFNEDEEDIIYSTRLANIDSDEQTRITQTRKLRSTTEKFLQFGFRRAFDDPFPRNLASVAVDPQNEKR